ncbi:uncharacterized protein LOC126948418 [Macaca thibetana thibetana]|uniref:uncharacterized protein LOC126948418 n=1 Tax=Macaca thibetana thibetana TaxID=257877 RepID=UPI0021BCF4FE|nr:uncharacterized protein LOC126948418 [Macaca thibetana thibetana]
MLCPRPLPGSPVKDRESLAAAASSPSPRLAGAPVTDQVWRFPSVAAGPRGERPLCKRKQVASVARTASRLLRLGEGKGFQNRGPGRRVSGAASRDCEVRDASPGAGEAAGGCGSSAPPAPRPTPHSPEPTSSRPQAAPGALWEARTRPSAACLGVGNAAPLSLLGARAAAPGVGATHGPYSEPWGRETATEALQPHRGRDHQTRAGLVSAPPSSRRGVCGGAAERRGLTRRDAAIRQDPEREAGAFTASPGQ